jgi:hypothetical protein
MADMVECSAPEELNVFSDEAAYTREHGPCRLVGEGRKQYTVRAHTDCKSQALGRSRSGLSASGTAKTSTGRRFHNDRPLLVIQFRPQMKDQSGARRA